MKKIGEYTARGIITEAEVDAGNPQRITLFDGRFDTGYKVTGFKIWGSNYGGTSINPDVIGKLSTSGDSDTTPGNFMRADNNDELAWASSASGLDGGGAPFAESIIDSNNLVVEDLWIYGRCTGADTVIINYMVTMEKYEMSDWNGALAMVRNKSQG